jgi:hypothetical protein
MQLALPPMQTAISKRQLLAIIFAVIVWLAAIGFGMAWLVDYEFTAGVSSLPPRQWPEESAIEVDPRLPTLVLIAHPHCPCTRASLSELERLLARNQGKTNTYIVFASPTEAEEQWSQTSLWETARAIPNVKVLVDSDLAESQRFRIRTSGHVVLYDANGNLQFSGGVTSSRGHAGDNLGIELLGKAINEGFSQAQIVPVFGCSLDRNLQDES